MTNLTEADKSSTRKEIARIAGGSEGYVDKVKFILIHAVLQLLEAAKFDFVKIHRAWQISQRPHAEQIELLAQDDHKDLYRKVDVLIRAHKQDKCATATLSAFRKALQALGRLPGFVAFVTEMDRALTKHLAMGIK